MVTGDKGHNVFTLVRALSKEVKPYSCLIDIDDMGSTRVDLVLPISSISIKQE